MGGDELQGCGQHGGVIRKAEHRHDVGQAVERHDKIGERGEQDEPHVMRRAPVDRAIEGGDEIGREGDQRQNPFQLAPEATANRGLVVASGAGAAADPWRR